MYNKTNDSKLFLFKDPNYAANRRTSLNENADPKLNTKNKKDNVSISIKYNETSISSRRSFSTSCGKNFHGP